MSRLSHLAKAASDYLRQRILGTSGGRLPPGSRDRRTGAPPVIPGGNRSGGPPLPPREITGNAPADDDGDDEFSDVRLLGRDHSYDAEDWEAFRPQMRQVNSSNVYAYGYQQETASMGILYVTFLNWVPREFGGDGSRSGPGPTYAYYDFPLAKYRAFESLAVASAGSAVWDFCRVRHSVFEHQHTYRLIQPGGEYVPRKATAAGFKLRTPAGIGIGRRNSQRLQQLAPRDAAFRRQLPRRNYAAGPNRAEPSRGEPNRGR